MDWNRGDSRCRETHRRRRGVRGARRSHAAGLAHARRAQLARRSADQAVGGRRPRSRGGGVARRAPHRRERAPNTHPTDLGLEIAREGGLIERDGELYCFDRVSLRTWKPRHETFDCGLPYRGYRWFDRYESEQLDAVARLVDELCARFDVPRLYPAPPFGQTLRDVAGLRPTLDDAPPAVPATVALSGSKPSRDFSREPGDREHRDALFAANARCLSDVPVAGSLVKTLLMELERRRVYLELATPLPDAHAVEYDVVHCDPREVERVARALGFQGVTGGMLEVRCA